MPYCRLSLVLLYYLYVQNLETQAIPYSENIGRSLSCHLGLSDGKWRVYVTAVNGEDDMKSSHEDFAITTAISYSISLNRTTDSMTVGEHNVLTATVVPAETPVSWSSSNPSVATVSGGKVTAVKAGTATITATAGSKTASCAVTVTDKNIAVQSVTLNSTSLALAVGESGTLTASVNPSNATDKTVTWNSSNTSVATVSGGRVTAVKAGTATITATAGGKSASCTVTVSEKVIVPKITTTSVSNGAVKSSFNQVLTASGSTPITWAVSSGTLPAGLTLSTGGAISGIPVAAGTVE